MNVLQFAHNIYNDEVDKMPILKSQEKIIYISAILHDMCDKKYIDETEGIKEIENFLKDDNKLTPLEIHATKKIIQTMSYSTVKKNGFPHLNEFQTAYHIVREADLLSAYDFDRCMIYDMYKKSGNFHKAFDHANELFENRVFKHDSDGLLLTDYAKNQHYLLQHNAHERMKVWKSLLNNRSFF
jgi:hypothetical protein